MLNSRAAGNHFLQIPGPTNVPDRVLRVMAAPTIDHRGPEFGELARGLLRDVRKVFKTNEPVVIYPSSGTGAWEAALANTLSPGERVLMFETGHFATGWRKMAERLDLVVDFIPGDWRRGADPDLLELKLAEDKDHQIAAVCVVHNETSTGVASRIADLRQAMDRTGHPALLLVDTISSLASIDFRHDEWGVDVTVGCSQKGLMLPPGLGFNAISKRARERAKSVDRPFAYWHWEDMLSLNEDGYFPYTPPTNLFYGLREAIDMLFEEGLDAVFARHARHAEATRRAVRAWALELQCEDNREYSNSLTAVRLPEGHDADRFREIVLDRFNMSLGNGLAKLKGRVFRIGHLGNFSDPMLSGTLAGVEMGLGLAGVPREKGGVQAAIDYLEDTA
jgi:alanine-glyoxylate transaminase/serine-glyoxylate transaminase/serine-pyruvate transaminase